MHEQMNWRLHLGNKQNKIFISIKMEYIHMHFVC
jgi:hypothetical protein